MVGSSRSPPWLNYIELLHDLRPSASTITHPLPPLTLPPLNPHPPALQTISLPLLSIFYRQILSAASNQSLPSTCSTTLCQTTVAPPGLLTLITTTVKTTDECFASTRRSPHARIGLQLQCPHQLVAPPAQHNRQQYPPHPPLPYPPPDEIAAHAAVSAIPNQAHHNRAPAKK
jgi:hypothetical protein